GSVPTRYFAKENLGKRWAVEHELTRLDPLEIDDRHVATDHGRKLDEPRGGKVGRFKRHVGRAKRDRFGLDLLDAAARTYRLVIQPVARFFFIGIGPFRIDRKGKGRTSARNIHGA